MLRIRSWYPCCNMGFPFCVTKQSSINDVLISYAVFTRSILLWWCKYRYAWHYLVLNYSEEEYVICFEGLPFPVYILSSTFFLKSMIQRTWPISFLDVSFWWPIMFACVHTLFVANVPFVLVCTSPKALNCSKMPVLIVKFSKMNGMNELF